MKHITYTDAGLDCYSKGCSAIHKSILKRYPFIKSSDGQVEQECGKCGRTWINGENKELKHET